MFGVHNCWKCRYFDNIPSPPEWASITEVPTGVPGWRPSSAAVWLVSPEPTGSPGDSTVVPGKTKCFCRGFDSMQEQMFAPKNSCLSTQRVDFKKFTRKINLWFPCYINKLCLSQLGDMILNLQKWNIRLYKGCISNLCYEWCFKKTLLDIYHSSTFYLIFYIKQNKIVTYYITCCKIGVWNISQQQRHSIQRFEGFQIWSVLWSLTDFGVIIVFKFTEANLFPEWINPFSSSCPIGLVCPFTNNGTQRSVYKSEYLISIISFLYFIPRNSSPLSPNLKS